MTFRIDYIRRHKGEWEFDMKGIEGKGVYGFVMTDGNGRGLYLRIPARDFVTPDGRKELLPEEEFHIPPEATSMQATRLVAKALKGLGWGPEVDQRNRVLNDEDPSS